MSRALPSSASLPFVQIRVWSPGSLDRLHIEPPLLPLASHLRLPSRLILKSHQTVSSGESHHPHCPLSIYTRHLLIVATLSYNSGSITFVLTWCLNYVHSSEFRNQGNSRLVSETQHKTPLQAKASLSFIVTTTISFRVSNFLRFFLVAMQP